MKFKLVVLNLLLYYCVAALIYDSPDNRLSSLVRIPPRHLVAESKAHIKTEPTCEELKAMWSFYYYGKSSKREMKGALTSNEIPAHGGGGIYTENNWQHIRRISPANLVATTRSGGGSPVPVPARSVGKVIYGKIIYGPPQHNRINPNFMAPYLDFVGHYSQPFQSFMPLSRINYPFQNNRAASASQKASFNKLRELVMVERARELYRQRVAEEAAARRLSLLKNIGRNPPGRYTKNHFIYEMKEPRITSHDRTTIEEDEEEMLPQINKEMPQRKPGILVFPDLLAPPAPLPGDDQLLGRFVSQVVFDNDADNDADYFHSKEFNEAQPDYDIL